MQQDSNKDLRDLLRQMSESFLETIAQYEKALIESQLTKRDAQAMQELLPQYTGHARSLCMQAAIALSQTYTGFGYDETTGTVITTTTKGTSEWDAMQHICKQSRDEGDIIWMGCIEGDTSPWHFTSDEANAKAAHIDDLSDLLDDDTITQGHTNSQVFTVIGYIESTSKLLTRPIFAANENDAIAQCAKLLKGADVFILGATNGQPTIHTLSDSGCGVYNSDLMNMFEEQDHERSQRHRCG